MQYQRLRTIFLLFASLLLASCYPPLPSSRAECLQRTLKQQPGLKNGVIAYSKADGNTHQIAADLTGWTRLALDRRYRAASLTKPLVASIIKSMIAAGDFNLDTSIATLLPDHDFTSTGTAAITVRHLLQHTAGFGHPFGLDPLWQQGIHSPRVPDCAAGGRYILSLPTEHPPGARTDYSNVGYCLLGEIILRRAGPEHGLTPTLRKILQSDYGAAGGWRASIADIHAGLSETLPIEQLPPPPTPLDDGSWYTYGWRWRPTSVAGAHWTHTGRLPGFLAIALTDGEHVLLVAHFNGDPANYLLAADRFGHEAWPCMEQPD